MAETHLALLSPDNILRIIQKNGHGIEEQAAIALGHDYPLPELMDLIETLIEVTSKPAPKPKAIPVKATEKKKKPAPAKKKSKRERGPDHTWLSSSELIHFVDEHPGLTVSEVAHALCEKLSRTYDTSSKGDSGIISSRASNLVVQKKLVRNNGKYYSTPFGLEWASVHGPNTKGQTEGSG